MENFHWISHPDFGIFGVYNLREYNHQLRKSVF